MVSFRQSYLKEKMALYCLVPDSCRSDPGALSIAEDGQIDSAEQKAFDSIVRELDGIVQAAMALKFSKGQDGR